MARQCHLNTCPVGIATQDPSLRRKFSGSPELVMGFFSSLAADVRRLLAELGFRSLDKIVGRSDLLTQKTGLKLPKDVTIDLGPMLRRADPSSSTPRRFTGAPDTKPVASLTDAVDGACSQAIRDGTTLAATFEIRNTDRTIGARLAGAIARRYGGAGLRDETIDLTFVGSAGQSFGAFNIAGLRLTLIGEANDYVGKGMSGGEIVIRPPDDSRFEWSQNVIIGNTVMYGATGGSLFVAGRAGERFCVRNSGGLAVAEGVGDHGCEYMTAGAVVVLGDVGRNFAAGMTGGVAYVFDKHRNLQKRCNQELVELSTPGEHEFEIVRSLIVRHYETTGSPRARDLLSSWERSRHLFSKVVTQAEAARHREAELPHINVPAAVERSTSFVAAE
jgi:glutamate synthase domain-containing protein 3